MHKSFSKNISQKSTDFSVCVSVKYNTPYSRTADASNYNIYSKFSHDIYNVNTQVNNSYMNDMSNMYISNPFTVS